MTGPPDDIERRLRETLTHHADHATISPDAHHHITTAIDRRRRPAVTAALAVAGVVVLVVVGALGWVLGARGGGAAPGFAGPGGGGPATEPASPAPGGAAATAGTAGGWLRVPPGAADGLGADGPAEVLDVALDEGGRAVAVGRIDDAAAVWTSDAPGRWTRQPTPPRPGGATAVMGVVTPFGGGLVAAGLRGAEAAAWTSTDGASWTTTADGTFGANTFIRDVVATPTQVVAVGEVSAGSDRGGAVWTSTDGAAWRRVEGLGPIPPVTSVAVGAGVVALTADGRALTSGDGGATWQVGPAGLGDGGGAPPPVALLAGPRGYLLAGVEVVGDSSRVVLRRTATVPGTWTTEPVPDSAEVLPSSIASDGRHLVVGATDVRRAVTDDFFPVVYLGDADGSGLRPVVTAQQPGSVARVAVGGGRAVAVGSLVADGTPTATIWETTLP